MEEQKYYSKIDYGIGIITITILITILTLSYFFFRWFINPAYYTIIIFLTSLVIIVILTAMMDANINITKWGKAYLIITPIIYLTLIIPPIIEDIQGHTFAGIPQFIEPIIQTTIQHLKNII